MNVFRRKFMPGKKIKGLHSFFGEKLKFLCSVEARSYNILKVKMRRKKVVFYFSSHVFECIRVLECGFSKGCLNLALPNWTELGKQ